MYSNQIVPYNNPSLVGTPYIDQVSQYTAYMNAVCGFHDGYKRFQTVVKDNYDQTQLNLICRSGAASYDANAAESCTFTGYCLGSNTPLLEKCCTTLFNKGLDVFKMRISYRMPLYKFCNVKVLCLNVQWFEAVILYQR